MANRMFWSEVWIAAQVQVTGAFPLWEGFALLVLAMILCDPSSIGSDPDHFGQC